MQFTDLDPGALALLQQGYRNNWQQYLGALNGQGAQRPHWDLCVLTASNERQAEAYEAQLDMRREAGLLATDTRFRVITDPDGLRIGSGGATLRVLSLLARELRAEGGRGPSLGHPLAGRRVLIIHSGGDSRRLPHCSAIGKLFARVPHALPDGRPSSLFDEFLVSLSGLPGQIPEGVLIASGDVLLLFDHLQLRFDRPGITGVAAASPAEMGAHHGVYQTAPASHRVQAFLHKLPVERLQAEGVVDADGRVPLDTGLVWCDRATTARLLGLADQLANAIAQGIPVSLYGDLLAPLAERTTHAGYLEDASDGPAHPLLRDVRGLIWDLLRGTPFSVEALHPALFIHFGTTREYLQVLREGVQLLAGCGWSERAASWLPPAHAAQAEECLIAVNSVLHDGAGATGCLLDTRVSARLELVGEALLAHVTTARDRLALEDGLVLDQLPLREDGGYVTRLTGVYDDPKLALGEGGTFLNRPWADWLAAAALSPDDLWPHVTDPAQRTLWEAQLYPACADRESSLDLVLWLQAPGAAPAETVARWRAARRLSLGESYVRADVRHLVQEQAEIGHTVCARRFCAGLERERPAVELASVLGGPADVAPRVRQVADWLENSPDPWLPIRGYRALAVATGEERWNDRAFASLARLVRAHTVAPALVRLADGAGRPQATVRLPARIDFGGGWTDTPPYSLERGGAVLNAAIALRGELPITATAERLAEPVLELVCRDIEATVRPRYAGEVLDYARPGDPFALAKAALVFRGILPADVAPATEIADLLRPLGCGLRLTTATSIPRGSGLGTSSILAGAVLRCLADLLGQELSPAQLFDEVLCLEQMITTGGGWQDQVGGLVPGVKFITTRPGLPQVALVEPVPLGPALRQAFDERLVLIYTGQVRLAKNLLRTIMGRWMARDREMTALLREIATLARAMRDALLAEDPDTLGALVGEHWMINRRMDPGCTNPFLDDLFATCAPYLAGGKLAGAGGGGFALAVAQDAAAADALGAALAARYPRGDVARWPCAIAEAVMDGEAPIALAGG